MKDSGLKLALLVLCGILVAVAAGCDSYLDVAPDERATEEDAFQNADAAENYLYSIYSYIPNDRVARYSPHLLTADEVVTPFEHLDFAQFPKGQFTASNPVLSNWNGLYTGVRQAYIMINNVDGVPGLSETLKANYKAEARFLIGYFHFLLARAYGPVVIQEDIAPVDVVPEDYPPRATYEETVNFIVDMMDQAAMGLPAERTGADYGRATSVAAKAIKARLLLYAASPLFNGGGESGSSFYSGFTGAEGTQLISTQYDESKWRRAADAAREAIDAAEDAGHGLYRNGENADGGRTIDDPTETNLRFVFIDENSSEVIWADTRNEGDYDFQNNSTPHLPGTSYNGYAPTLTMVEAFYTENGLPISEDPEFDYEDRFSVAEGEYGPTVSINLNREPRFDAWIAYHNSYYEIFRDGNAGIVVNFLRYGNAGIQDRSNNYSPTGYLNKKGIHPLLNQTSLQVTEQYPWPKIRLAELYLNYAEALIESGQDFNTAKEYIDRVRARAGVPSIDEAWAPIGGASDQETLRSIVRQERTIELYLEGHRFWDLRRWMTAEQYLDDRAQGMNIQAETVEEFAQVTTVQFPRAFRSPAHYLLPIPIAEVNRNPQLVQNPGY